jgi:hypothetical protein
LAETRLFLGQWRRKKKLAALLAPTTALGRAKRGIARMAASALPSLACIRPFPSAAADALCALAELFGQKLTPEGTLEVLHSDTLQRALLSIKPTSVIHVPYALHRLRAWLLLSGSGKAFLEDCTVTAHPCMLRLARWLLALSQPVAEEVQAAMLGQSSPHLTPAQHADICTAVAVADASVVAQLQQAMTAAPVPAMPAWALAAPAAE